MALETIPQISLLDVVRFKGLDGREIINEVPMNTPAFSGRDSLGNSVPVAFDTIDGTYVRSLVRTGLPDIDPFRIINAGASMSQGQYEPRQYPIQPVTRYAYIDQALYDTDESGVRYFRQNMIDQVEQTFKALEREFFYGKSKQGNPSQISGFQGLEVFTDPEMLHDAKGTGTGAMLASAYLINFNKSNGVTWLIGQNGEMSFSDPVPDDIPDQKNPGKMIPVLSAKLNFYPGIAVYSRFSVSRICNIDTKTAFTAEKAVGAFTDETIATAISKWPEGAPNAIIMNKAAGMMLAASRTVTRLTNAGAGGADITVTAGYATLPKEHNGIPIAYSDALIRTETKVTVPASA